MCGVSDGSPSFADDGFDRFEIPVDHARLVAERIGAGVPVVALHAGVADRRAFRPFARELADVASVVAYDRRGYGDTTYTRGPFAQVDDLLAVLDATATEPAWLVGSSQGGRIAIDCALAEPERVAGLVLLAPALSGDDDEPELSHETARLDRLIEDGEARGELDVVNRHEAHLWLDGPAQVEGRVGGPARDLFLDMNAHALAAADPGIEREPRDATGRLGSIAAPTLVLCGGLDVEPMIDLGARIAREIPGAEHELLPGVAHLPYLERPAGLAARVRAFLTR
jgi:pimeloyl-ACP methyl ester carboxylesterase